MKSSNPALGRIPSGQGNATWNQGPVQNAPSPGQLQDMYAQPAYAPPGYQAPSRYMTIDDVVTKTGITLLVTILSAAATWFLLEPEQSMPLAIGAVLIGFVLGLVISFKTITNPVAILAYAAVEGVFLGGISQAFNARYPGIVVQAVVGTAGVTAVMLGLYKSGRIRVTPKFTKMVVGATIGFFVLLMVNLVAGIFVDGGLGLRQGPLGILVGLFAIGLASLNLVLDFDMVERGARQGLPTRYGWFAAFGIMVTLVWLYVEMLRLLSILRD